MVGITYIHMRGAFSVARFDLQGNAKAFMRGTSDRIGSTFFYWYVATTLLKRNPSGSQGYIQRSFMKRKRVVLVFFLSLMMSASAQAQDIQTDSVSGSTVDQKALVDSLQVLSSELAKIKSHVSQVEKVNRLEKIWKRKKYIKIGYATPSIERTDGEEMEWETDFAISLQKGKTAYLHAKPLWGMVKFGIDYGFLDVSYAKLKLKNKRYVSSSGSIGSGSSNADGFDEIVSDDPNGSILDAVGIKLGMHKFEYTMHVGPSISVNPWNHLIISAYFHAIPTASGLVQNDTFSYGFGCAMSAGISIAYKCISVGVEGLWSKIKYTQASFDDEEDVEDGDVSIFDTEKFKLKENSTRFYIAFRF